MSETTGVGVEKLSQFAYAARRAGVSNEALANGLKRMQSKEFQAMFQGIGKGGGMKGLTAGAVAGLGTGDATDQLRNFIKMTENMPTAEKIGLARRLGLSELLPLINQGVDALDAFTARARQLGLVMSEEDAKAGKKFTQAFGDLADVLKSSVGQIGGALIPMITGLTNVVVPIVAAIRDWIKQHKYLTVALFLGTGAIVAAGIALKGLAVVTAIAGKAMTVLQWALKGVSLAFSVLSTAIGWLPMLANPWVLAGLAIAGVVVWIAKLAGSFDGLSALWNGLASDFADSFGAIANALSKGDIQAAWNVVTAFLKVEWVRVTEYLAQAWANFSDYFMGLLDHYVPWVSTTFRAIGKAWDWTEDHVGQGMHWLAGVWRSICDVLESVFSGALKRVSDAWNGFMDKIAQWQQEHDEKGLKKAAMPSEAAIRNLAQNGRSQGMTNVSDDEAVANAKAKQALGTRTDTSDVISAAEVRRKDAKDLADKEKAEFEDRKKKRAMEADARLQAAHLDLKKAIDAANAAGPGRERQETGRRRPHARPAILRRRHLQRRRGRHARRRRRRHLAEKQADAAMEAVELHRQQLEVLERQHDGSSRKIDENMAKAAEIDLSGLSEDTEVRGRKSWFRGRGRKMQIYEDMPGAVATATTFSVTYNITGALFTGNPTSDYQTVRAALLAYAPVSNAPPGAALRLAAAGFGPQGSRLGHLEGHRPWASLNYQYAVKIGGGNQQIRCDKSLSDIYADPSAPRPSGPPATTAAHRLGRPQRTRLLDLRAHADLDRNGRDPHQRL